MRGYAVGKQTLEDVISYFYANSFMLWYLSKEQFCKKIGRRFNLHWRTISKIINNKLNPK